jgi:hypothetical protein
MHVKISVKICYSFKKNTDKKPSGKEKSASERDNIIIRILTANCGRTLTLDYSKKDSLRMSKSNAAMKKINRLNVIEAMEKRMVFELNTSCLN